MDIVKNFQSFIYDFYNKNKRAMAWREDITPYTIVVSEIMLQQTQVDRVAKKFPPFMHAFPSFEDLASAQLRDVIIQWQGLGYNRRAKALHAIAQKVVHEYSGILPNDPEVLVTFSGIGKATAGSICAFAFNMPTIFIETNIRAVFIDYFFPKKEEVSDKEIFPLIEKTLDHKKPRQWYYALMDYGTFLKKKKNNPSRKSRHYTKQSRFEGSDRQIRGEILRLLVQFPVLDYEQLACEISDSRLEKILENLCTEKLVQQKDNQFFL